MAGRVEGKVALVTGGASGIGAGCAETLAREGAVVVITDLQDAKGAEEVAAIKRTGGKARYLHHDVTSEDEWVGVVADIEKSEGRLDVLVNNAGIGVACPSITMMKLEDWRRQQAVNVEGVFLGIKHSLPLMRKSGKGGSIINMSSVASHLGYPVFFAYSAAKGAVRAMTKSIAVHCQMNKYHIRCNSVHAGAIETPMVAAANEALGLKMADYEAAPWGLGKPADVANVVVFLASDESRFINGTEIVIDNALTIQ